MESSKMTRNGTIGHLALHEHNTLGDDSCRVVSVTHERAKLQRDKRVIATELTAYCQVANRSTTCEE